ncbi:uncharacterized protein LOC116264778 [Nymphaea colorata]|nr:uncharacterized protein LOC116264778 [Nymphaea colorata]
MNGRMRSSSRATKREERLHRFLKPGALAQMRDSRISARVRHLRPPKKSDLTPNAPSSRVPTLAHQISLDDFFCCPSSRFSGPGCLQRKKLVAVKSGFVCPPSPSSPVAVIADDSILESFNGDMVSAH